MIEEQALNILQQYPEFLEIPTSLSGKHHSGENHFQHAKETANAMKHLCKEFNINKEDTDMLVGASLLHDIGVILITKKGKIELPFYEYYEKTDYSRVKSMFSVHGILSALVIEKHELARKTEIQKLVSLHMSRWCKECPQPTNLYEYLICVADYIVTFGTMVPIGQREG